MRRTFRRAGALALSLLAWQARPVAGQTMTREAPATAASTRSAAPAPAASAADIEALRDELARVKAEFEALRRQYDDRLVALEQQLAQLTGGPSVPAVAAGRPAETPRPGTPAPLSEAAEPLSMVPAPAPAAPAPAAGAEQQPPLPAASAASSKVFNPDTSVVGNFVGTGGKNPFSDRPAFELNEAEVAFQAIVDPYARADFYLAASPEGLEIEEGFITFTSLPANLLVKAGKLRAAFGKVNTLHTHTMPTVDRPLVTENLVGGEEGLSDSGVSVARLFPNPYVFLEATAEVYASRSDVFRTDGRSRLTYVGHARAYRDLTEDMNLELGGSFAHGPADGLVAAPLLADPAEPTAFSRQLFGIDATFRYRPLRRAIYRRLNLRTELVWSRTGQPSLTRTSAFGFYALGEYQFARRWYLGGRVDRSGRAFEGSLVDTGASAFLTFWPTEFSQIRSQYRRTRYAERTTAHEVLFQLNFAIGAHGAHAF